ncbi:MAG: ribonuclease BN [unclassified Hahellaceae]|nr:ribonuclease BN [Hahellaceae bacterium]|tara:strand:+ start:95909 stop:96850 length:942 start_codon:yes stop_codon:yes gene_type:complete
MFEQKRVACVVPCFNESLLIKKVISNMPACVDAILIVDDCSTDDTVDIVERLNDPRTVLLKHERNLGVGGSISTGYKYARDHDFDIAVVMAGDAQMDPEDLPAILQPVASGEVDYTKGNRLFSGDAWKMIPRVRYLGNSMLSLLTKIASGYWHVADSQSGYTAASKAVLHTINWDSMYQRYGQPNDLLVRLNIYNFRVRDVPIKPVYGIGEKSGVKPLRLIPKLSWLICRMFLFRMAHKYIIRDFHPLVFFYAFGLLLLPSGLLLGLYLMIYRIAVGGIAETSALFAAFLFITGVQFTLFAMWFDMENNRSLK